MVELEDSKQIDASEQKPREAMILISGALETKRAEHKLFGGGRVLFGACVKVVAEH